MYNRLALALVGLLLMVSPAAAQPRISAGADLVSRFLWRGYTLTPDPALQPALEATWGGLTLGTWASAAVTNRELNRDADEVDFTLSYSTSTLPLLDLTTGVSAFVYPSRSHFTLRDHATPEFFLKAAPRLPLSPQVNFHYDAHLERDFYASLSLSPEWSMLGHAWTLGLVGGYNHGLYGAAPGVSHLDVTLSTEIDLGQVHFAPLASYVRSFENTGEAGHHFWFGVHTGF